MTGKQLTFAVIGCGRMGQRRMQSIVDHPSTKLLYAVDVHKEYEERINDEFGCMFSTDYKKILSQTDVDCVIVSVQNIWHQKIVEYALTQNKHVWCEKPLARNPIEARHMVEIAKKSNVTLKTGANLRYFPSVKKAKELLDKKIIGETYYIRGWVGHSGWVQDGWFADKDVAGGGTFLDNGSHMFDLTRWFLGEVKSCYGQIKKYHMTTNSVEDNGFGFFETIDGKIAVIQSSWTEWNGYMYMEIYGAMGYIYIDNRGKNCKTIHGNKQGKERVFDYSTYGQNSYKKEFDDYIRSLKNGENPQPSGHDGLRAVEMAWGVYESSLKGTKIII